MAKNKRKFYINERISTMMFEQGYSLSVKVMNFYQFRLTHEERGEFFDYYHTQGTVVLNKNGAKGSKYDSQFNDVTRFGVFETPEAVAIAITDYFRKNPK